MSLFLLSQILIGVAFCFDIASFQFKKRNYTIVCFFCAASLISAHYFLLGAITAGAVIAFGSIRFIVSLFTTNKWVMYFFILAMVVIGLLTYDGLEDVLITCALIFSTLATFSENERRLRHFMMSGSTLTIIHNVLIFTPAAILLELFFLGSNIVSYWRFYLRKKNTH